MKIFKGLRGRLMLLLSIPLAALILGASLNYYASNQASEKISLLGEQRIPITAKVYEMESLSHAGPRYMWLSLANSANPSDRKKFYERGIEAVSRLKAGIDEYSGYKITAEAQEKIKSMREPATNLLEVLNQAAIYLAENKDEQAKEYLLTKMPPYAVKISEGLAQLSKIASAKNAEIVKASVSEAQNNMIMVISLAIASIIISAIVGLLIAMRLASQLTNVNEMVEGSSGQVSSASEQISNAAQQLASSSQEQASALEETAASLEELSGMVENNMKNAENSTRLAEAVRDTAEKSGISMKILTDSMTQIQESNKRIENLVKVIEEIGEKTAVIDEIVFQTKLLSFNASVEAERAGEHGRGFAVVAQEVGNLAQMSGKSALEISAIVKASVKEAQEIATQNREKVTAGNGHVVATANYLQEVQQKADSLLEGAKQILSASKEKNSGIKQINTSMDNLNKTTQSTAATAEEAASAAEELNSQAAALQELVGDLGEIIAGDSQVTGSRAPEVLSKGKVHHVDFKNKSERKYEVASTKKAAGQDFKESKDSNLDSWESL